MHGYFPHLAISADLRIHNRKDLIRHLGVDESPSSLYRDCDLLLAAYAKWDEECVEFLVGEFAFAIWDSRRRRLFCGRDQLGFRPFLYWKDGSRFLFASNIQTILAVPGVPRLLNPRKLGALSSYWGRASYPGETFHDGVMSLPPGCCITVDESDVRRREYWQPQIRPELVPRHPTEAFEALRELLFEAVDCRLEDLRSIGVCLSGGLDSSSLAAIASDRLGAKGQELLVLSAVLPPGVRGHSTDEREFIEEFRPSPNIRIEYVTAEGAGPFDFIHTPENFVRTPLRSSKMYLMDALERAAIARNAQLILWGDWGEMGATCSANRYYAQLAAHFQWPKLTRELWKLRNIDGRSPVRTIARELRDVLPFAPQRPSPYILLTTEFSGPGEAATPFRCASVDQRQYQAALMMRYRAGAAAQTGYTLGGNIRVSHPLGDKRVLEFCLSAPPELKVRNGYDRYLIRGALDGLLPKKIQWRTSKAPFSPDYFVRYNAQLGKAREFVAAIASNDPVRSVIDVRQLEKLMVAVPAGVLSPVARDVVPTTIYTICFLRQFAEFRL
jgi:asparagine synthase (glutamine-hydrolysing)